jgi:hypothetical protein
MLGKEVRQTGNPIATGFWDVVQMTSVVVLGWAKELVIKAVGCPQGRCIGIFVDDCFCAKGCHRVPIPVVQALKVFVGRAGGVYVGATK